MFKTLASVTSTTAAAAIQWPWNQKILIFLFQHWASLEDFLTSSFNMLLLFQCFILLYITAGTGTTCNCPMVSLKERYYLPETYTVVHANVTSVSNPCLSNPGGACISPRDGAKLRHFKLKLLKTFKGCGPMSSSFYASSKVGGCGEFLQVGSSHLLFLQKPQPPAEDSESVGYRETFRLCVCQRNIPWARVPAEYKVFLDESAREKKFICDH